MKHSVSVVLTTCLKSKLLYQVIDSILSQAQVKLELIIVVDTPNVFETKFVENNRCLLGCLKVLQNSENIGQAASLNRGISEASYPMIAIADDDDIWISNVKLYTQLAYLNKCNIEHGANCSVVSTRAVYALSPNARNNNLNKKYFSSIQVCRCESDILEHNPIVHSSVVFYKKIFIQSGGYDSGLRRSQDLDLWFRILKIGEIHILPEKMVLYDISQKTIMQKIKNKILDLICDSKIYQKNGIRLHLLLLKNINFLASYLTKLAKQLLVITRVKSMGNHL